MPPTVIYYVAASLDGFIARADGHIDWLTPYDSDPEVGQDFPTFDQTTDGMIMGRTTAELLLKLDTWPHPGKPCWIVTSRPINSRAPEIIPTRSSPREILGEATERGCSRIWLVGGGVTAGAFLEANLIDECRITYVPIVLGEGIPLFGTKTVSRPWQTESVKTFSCGLTQLHVKRTKG